jgi:CDP-diacylglycerol--glycerol-3-phosphate 3-phosphatidyltransferase
MKIVIIPLVVKERFKQLLEPVIRFLIRYELNPNFLTTFSLIISLFSAYQFAKGSLRLGAILLLLSGIFDMVDGAVARATNRVTRFGALYDSTLDRYAEIIVFFGIGFHLVHKYPAGSKISLFISMAVFIAIAGSIMVSYVRARAEGLGFQCKVGLMQRPERLVLLSLGALISTTLLVVMIVAIALLANFTAFERVYHVWAVENDKKWGKLPSDIDHE